MQVEQSSRSIQTLSYSCSQKKCAHASILSGGEAGGEHPHLFGKGQPTRTSTLEHVVGSFLGKNIEVFRDLDVKFARIFTPFRENTNL